MNRLEFFQYMKKSMLDTLKHAVSPFIEEDIRKIERFTDEIGGIQWVPCEMHVGEDECKTAFLNGRSVAIYRRSGQLTCYELVCMSCQTLVHYVSSERMLTCLQCSSSYQLDKGEGDLQLHEYPVQEGTGYLQVGFGRE